VRPGAHKHSANHVRLLALAHAAGHCELEALGFLSFAAGRGTWWPGGVATQAVGPARPWPWSPPPRRLPARRRPPPRQPQAPQHRTLLLGVGCGALVVGHCELEVEGGVVVPGGVLRPRRVTVMVGWAGV
jgi:hypothetical protein